ncbi:response regulator transcription factor [Joostella atrarenae]|uniref:Response regulator transcription factor n=1 Tax=Joostella atrarenae TaxID=679257 RepID=A0ABS9J4W6_9FLAO|nr:response regulator transcription factor [Joostella atrarenae]MCF8715463.1 response regulator transcription factor [Joostella atrarenae]
MHVVILDDHKMITDMVREILQDVPEVRHIETFTSHLEFLGYLKENEVNLIILDVFMPETNGLEVIKEVRAFKKDDQYKIIVLSSSVSTKIMRDAISLGANAYITKQDAVSDLISAIVHFKEGNSKPYFSKNATLAMVDNFHKKDVKLSPRETQLLQLMCDGMTAKEIAFELDLSVNTIHFYSKRLMAKMDVNRTVDLILKALEEGYVISK